MDFNYVKCIVSGILTSSKNPVSIDKFRRYFVELEGMNVPYKSFGFNSDIELLQSMSDILTLPQNPNSSSLMCLILNEKNYYMRMLVVKQNIKNKKLYSNGHGKMRNNSNQNYKTPNSSQNNLNNNPSDNYQNRNNYNKYYTRYSYDDNNQKNQTSTSKSRIDINKKNLRQNETHSSGNVTDKLRAYQFHLSQNRKGISKKTIEESKSDECFVAFKTEKMNDSPNKVQHFLIINNTGIVLKNKDQSEVKDYTSPIYQPSVLVESIILLNALEINQSSYKCHSHENSFANNCFNDSHKIINNAKQFDCDQYNDINVLPELKTNLKINDCLSNIVFVDNFKTFLYKTKHIPEKVLFSISKIFEVYSVGINFENFKFIYNVEYYSTIDPSAYGYTTAVQMFKDLDEFIDIKNEVMYTKSKFFMLYKNIHFNNDESGKQLKNDILMENNSLKISLDIYEKSPFFDYSIKHKMVMVEAYNPSLFFLHLESNIGDFTKLMDDMLKFYETENSNYYVRPEYIIPGFVYASSYTTFPHKKQWHRVRILREVDVMTVEVIHVDYGTVDNIPKTEIRFLYDIFSKLPCQAIQCCLDGYNELKLITKDVLSAFVKIIDDKQVYVSVDEYFCLKSGYKIFHVTLFQYEDKTKDTGKLKNINYELTIHHLHH